MSKRFSSDNVVARVRRVRITREAGEVRRTHTLGAACGDIPPTVGMHTYNMLMMLLVLHPDPSVHLIRAVAFHDVHERFTGDVPRPALQARGGALAKAHGLIARDLDEALGFSVALTPEEENWLFALDHVEFMLWLNDQTMLGNAKAAPVYRECHAKLRAKFALVPGPVRELLANYHPVRTPDTFDVLLTQEKDDEPGTSDA